MTEVPIELRVSSYDGFPDRSFRSVGLAEEASSNDGSRVSCVCDLLSFVGTLGRLVASDDGARLGNPGSSRTAPHMWA
jgi:hypothetical protein